MRGTLCSGHYKQDQLGKPLTPLRDVTRSPMEQAIDAMAVLMEADGDEEYERARANVARALKSLSANERIAAMQAARAASARRGTRMGRKPKADAELAAKLASRIGPARAARQLGVSLRTIWRYIRRVTKN